MNVAVIGGKLQGVEATYLAHQAGWHVTLLDKNPQAPAVGLADEYREINVLLESNTLVKILRKMDFVVPAVEDYPVLNQLEKATRAAGVPLAFDGSAYAISSSKKKSDRLFSNLAIPAPAYWPSCQLPVIAKPSAASGSQGVRKICDQQGLNDFLQGLGYEDEDWVIQEFIEGSTYSIEVLGYGGRILTLQTTDLAMDRRYDCKRVCAPTELSASLEGVFRKIAAKIAECIQLNGIMDVEVINHNGMLKVLEIDARLPSQTPTVVYKSTGINILQELHTMYTRGVLPAFPDKLPVEQAVIYEHIQVSPKGLESLGEHIMSQAGPLHLEYGFFGADEALTNYPAGGDTWVATLIMTDLTREGVWAKRHNVLENIKERFGLLAYLDSEPGN